MGKKLRKNWPTIGITGPDKGGGVAWTFTALSVLVAGGWPVRIRPARPRSIEGVQGLIIGGGADVDPDTYAGTSVLDEYLKQTLEARRRPLSSRIASFFRLILFPVIFLIRRVFSRRKGLTFGLDKDRDRLEFYLLDQAVAKHIPVLGICRGAQLINVYFKGTLYRNLASFYFENPNPASIFPVKKVFLEPKSKLATILQIKALRVNALHNQAVKEAGETIAIVAREANEVVQAIETSDKRFIIGVQWHPEYLIQQKIQRRLFKALVQAAKALA